MRSLLKSQSANTTVEVEETDRPKLHALTPTVLTEDEFAPYVNDFDKVFAPDSKVLNIALSGPFGAGKSSVIETCMGKRKAEKWAKVELAHFDGQESDKSSLEAEVLNQLIRKVGTEKAPKSRFSQTHNRTKKRDIFIAAVGILAILLLVQLASYGPSMFASDVQPVRWIGVGCVVALLTIALYAAYTIVRRDLIGRTVKRLKFMDAELEVFAAADNADFNACMDDLVYLLSCSDVTAIVFEDLDRFNSIDLLEKLRELNALSNASRESAGGKPLRFFYLIRDGVFASARDRTKFFDYVIPVIPYVDPANAQGILQEGLQGIGLAVDEGFLFDLSVFIDDPRVLKDIINETNHFRTALFRAGRELGKYDAERLVAMVTYKVVFPSDYELLQVRRGYMYTLLSRHQWLIDTLCESMNNEMIELESQLSEIGAHATLSENETKLLFAATRFKEVSGHENRFPSVNFAGLTNANDVMDAIVSNKDRQAAFERILADLEENEEFQARMKEARSAKDRESLLCRTRIKALSRQQRTIASMSIASLIGRLGDASDFFILEKENFDRKNDFEELGIADFMDRTDFGLVRHLVSSGWIDESYPRYMSAFRPGGLSAGDSDYLASLLQVGPLDSSYVPDDAGEVVRRMTPQMFERRNARNHALVKAVLKDPDKSKLDSLMASVKDDPTPAFIVGYVTGPAFSPDFFSPMFDYLEDPIKAVVDDMKLEEGDKSLFFQRLIAYGSVWLEGEGPDGALSQYVSNVESFLDFAQGRDAAFVDGLEAIGYHPASIDVESANQVVLEAVCERGLFEPVASLVNVLFDKVYGRENLLQRDELVREVVGDPENGLSKRIASNPELFVASLIEMSPDAVSSDEESVLWVLNNDKIVFETSSAYLSSVKGSPVSSVDSIADPDLRGQALAQGTVRATPSNVVRYFEMCDKKIDDCLGSYVRNFGLPKEMSHDAFADDGDASLFVLEMCGSKDVDACRFKEVIEHLKVGVVLPADDALPEEKVSALVDAGLVTMCADNLQTVRSRYPALTVDLVSSSPRDYSSLVLAEEGGTASQCTFDEDEVLNVFADTRIPGQIKVKLLQGFSHCVRTNRSYPESLNAGIISGSLFDSADYDSLPKLYDGAGSALAAAILPRIMQHRSHYLRSRVGYPWSFAAALLGCERIDEATALRFLTEQLNLANGEELSREEVRSAFVSAGLEDYGKLLAPASGGSMVRVSAENDAALNALERVGMCGKRGEPNDNGLRRVYAKGAKWTGREESFANLG